jgi:hypothetical protein
MGIMSNETARVLDPTIEDPQREADLVEIEGLRKALLTGLEQQASQGVLDPSVIARIAKMKAQQHMTLEDAVTEIHQEMQAQQAQQAQQMQQGEVGPEVQPGMGVNPQTNPIQGAAPQAGPASMQDLLEQLHGGGAQMAPAVAQAPAPAPAGV